MIKGDSYSTNQDFYDLQWKTFFFAWNEKLWYPDAQTPTHNRQSKSTTTLRSSEGEKKHEKKSIYSDKKCKNIAIDLSRHSLNCVMKVFTSFYWMWQKNVLDNFGQIFVDFYC